MDKEKQIKEMAKIVCNACRNNEPCYCKKQPCSVAEKEVKELYEHNYRKITENEIVISKEEYENIWKKGYEEGYSILVDDTIKKTAREILTFIGNMYDECDSRFKLKDYQWHKDLCKQYGVEIGEEE